MADELYKLPAVEHPLTEETVRNIVTSMRKFGTGQNVMVDGVERSQSYIPGVQGWQIDAEGNAEFNNGTFRGRFDIGGTTITIDNTDDIQENIDIISNAGGGTLYLQTGTYTLTADVSIPSGVKLQGVSRDGVILDCNASYKVKIVGSNAYTTGTVTISVGDTTVVGSGTTFTSAMVGRYILLGERGDFLWYEITAFTDTTHITIGSPYTGANLSGDTYTIATINSDATIGNLTISGATAEGLKIQYALEPIVDNIYVLSCGTGLDFDQVVFPLLYLSAFSNGVNANFNEVSGYEVRFSAFDDSTSGNGITMTSCGNATFFDSSASGNTGDGINMTNCNSNAFVSNSIDSNGGQGIELVSGCDDNQFIATNPNGNTSDGFKFTATSDRNTIVASSIINNGGYGVNIAAATCDDNQIIAPAFDNNTSGNINNSGTNTSILPEVALASGTFNTTATSANFTADASTDFITSNGHNLQDGDKVILSNSGGALPGGLSATTYYVRNKTTNTFKLCATNPFAAAVDITDAGTGTHTWTLRPGSMVMSFNPTVNLRIIIESIAPTVSGRVRMILNEDGAGTNYAYTLSEDGGAASAVGNAIFIELHNSSDTKDVYSVVEMTNNTSLRKKGVVQTNQLGAAAAAGRVDVGSCAWNNTTDQISKITVYLEGTGAFSSGSSVYVYGSN